MWHSWPYPSIHTGAASIVRLFINEGANVNAETETKDTALSLAVWKNHTDCAVLLMDARASVDRCVFTSFTFPLCFPCRITVSIL